MDSLVKGCQGPNSLLPVKYEIPAVKLLNQEDSRNRVAENQGLNETIHLWPPPDESPLEACGLNRLVFVPKSWHYDVAPRVAPD